MTKPIAAPINRETEMTIEEVAALAGAGLYKVRFVAVNAKYNFPAPRSGPRGKRVYSKAQVIQWLEANDLKAIVLTEEDKKPRKTRPSTKPKPNATIVNVAKLNLGTVPQAFSGKGTSVTVHVEERNDPEHPHSGLTRFSSLSAAFGSIPGNFAWAFE